MLKTKWFLIVALVPYGLYASFCDARSKGNAQHQDKRTIVQEQPKIKAQSSPEQLEKSILNLIALQDSTKLDVLLKSIDPTTKKNLLSKQMKALFDAGEKLTTVLNWALAFSGEEKNAVYDTVRVLIDHGADISASAYDGYNPLTRAASYNLHQVIELLIKKGAKINDYDANGITALYVAARQSHVALIPLLIKLGAKIDFPTKDGFIALRSTIYDKNGPVVEALIKHGANPSLSAKDGYNSLTAAAYANVPKMIELLVKKGAKINDYDANGITALHIAARQSHVALIPLLIKLGAKIDFPTKDGFSALRSAVDKNNGPVVEALIKHDANPSLSAKDGYNSLTAAADANLPKMIELLIKKGAKINDYDANGVTALFNAVWQSHIETVGVLLQLGADANKQNESGVYPLHVAFQKKNQAIIELLLQHNANVNVQDARGKNALHLAIENSYDSLISIIIDKGADVTICTNEYVSPLVLAASYGKQEIVKRLVQKQNVSVDDLKKTIRFNDFNAFKMLLANCPKSPFSDQEVAYEIGYYALAYGNRAIIDMCRANNKDFMNQDPYGHMPLHFAVMYGHDELVRYFVEQCHADINGVDYYGLTPLHYAVAYGNDDLVDYLVKKKCLLNQRSMVDVDQYKKGSTPYDIALQYGYENILNYLIKNGATPSTGKAAKIGLEKRASLILFLDFDDECVADSERLVSTKTAFSQELCDAIGQKTCPIIVIGQHLLQNALQLSCSLKDWVIVEFTHNDVVGYLIVPKKCLSDSKNNDANSLDTKLKNLGFALSAVRYAYVDELQVIKKRVSREIVKREAWSAQVSPVLDRLLLPHERCVYWGGHGLAGKESSVGGLLNNDAALLFNVLSNKKTKVVCTDSCFFGGKNFDTVGDFKNMIVVSTATTEASVSMSRDTRPGNWCGFFSALAGYKHYENPQLVCEYFANWAFPLLLSQHPNLSNIPHIKFPGSSFTLLSVNNEAMLIDRDMKNSLLVENKRLLEITIDSIKKPIEITQKIPLIVSKLNQTNIETMAIKAISENAGNDFVSILQALTQPQLFERSTLENLVLIKTLTFLDRPLPLAKGDDTKLPKTVYDVAICRGPGSACYAFLSTNKNGNAKNVICLTYVKNKQWDVCQSVSDEDFVLYRQLVT